MKSRVTVIVLSVLVAGCKISKPTALVPPSNIPQTFGFPADTVTKACIHWEKFYSDSLLISLIDTALVNNHDLQIALQRIEIARSDVRFARGQQFPVLSADVSAGKRKYGDNTADTVGTYDPRLSPNISSQQMIPDPIPDYFVGGFTTWELDVWGKLRNRRKAAVARFWASEKGAHMVKTNLVADVASTYYKLLSLDSKLHILEENIALQEKELRIVSIQKAAGHVTDLAIKQFESQLLNEKSDRIEVQQQIVETENKLNFLLGRYPQQIMRNEHILEKAMPAIVDVGVPSNLLVYRPDIQQAELDLVDANASVKAAR